MTEKFQPGDEIEWGGGARRQRGRVVYDEALGVRSYDEFGHLQDDAKIIPPDAKLTSATDLLAELVPDLYHLRDRYNEDENAPCRCGAVDSEGNHLRDLDPHVMHHATYAGDREVWDKLVRNTTWTLDATDRSRPLDQRQLPEGSADEARAACLCPECFRLAVLAQCHPEEPPRQSEEKLREFVLAWMDRRIFSHLHCDDTSLLSMIFMCLALGPPMPPDYAEKVGLIYEFMNQAGPRSINGYPMFLSCRLMHADDWERVRKVIVAEEERRENLAI